MAQGEEFLKARLEKDLAELKKMIDTHFVQRKKDEEEIAALETRIEERKAVRYFIISSHPSKIDLAEILSLRII